MIVSPCQKRNSVAYCQSDDAWHSHFNPVFFHVFTVEIEDGTFRILASFSISAAQASELLLGGEICEQFAALTDQAVQT